MGKTNVVYIMLEQSKAVGDAVYDSHNTPDD